MRIGDIFVGLPTFLMLILITATIRPRWIEWAHSFEDWSGWDKAVADGLDDLPWQGSTKGRVAEGATRYRARPAPAKRR